MKGRWITPSRAVDGTAADNDELTTGTMKTKAFISVLGIALAALPWLTLDAHLSEPRPEDTKECRAHLEKIHAAIQEYRKQNQRLPGYFHDLVPRFIADRISSSAPRAPATRSSRDGRRPGRGQAASQHSVGEGPPLNPRDHGTQPRNRHPSAASHDPGAVSGSPAVLRGSSTGPGLHLRNGHPHRRRLEWVFHPTATVQLFNGLTHDFTSADYRFTFLASTVGIPEAGSGGVALLPIIVRQPASQSVLAGSGVTLSAEAFGSSQLSYQWRHDGEAIPGATDATLVLPHAGVIDQGDYDVIVSNAAGSVTSLSATLTVTGVSWLPTIAGPVINPANGHRYYLLDQSDWLAAEVAAQTRGGHLATIRNAAEQAFVFSAFANYGGVSRHLYIGLYDTDPANNSPSTRARRSASRSSIWVPIPMAIRSRMSSLSLLNTAPCSRVNSAWPIHRRTVLPAWTPSPSASWMLTGRRALPPW